MHSPDEAQIHGVARRPTVAMTVDVEPDCPPFLWTWRGIEEGMPALLEVFREEAVRGTFFVTGATAERFPECVAAIVADGHELACHGYSHASFRSMSRHEARSEIERTNAILRTFAPVRSFRAPYLQLPEKFAELLVDAGMEIDCSRASYKWADAAADTGGRLKRIDASTTSSVLRLPAFIRDPLLARLRDPVVLFVHPWEFVDLRRAPIRYDCRFRTGAPAIACLKSVLSLFKARGASFKTVQEIAAKGMPQLVDPRV